MPFSHKNDRRWSGIDKKFNSPKTIKLPATQLAMPFVNVLIGDRTERQIVPNFKINSRHNFKKYCLTLAYSLRPCF